MNTYILKCIDYKGDGLSLLEAFSDQPGLFFLDSSMVDPHRGRYSFLGFDPFDIFTSKEANGLDVLKSRYEPFKNSFQSPLTNFSSGIVGFLSYDYGLVQEKIRSTKAQELDIPYLHFGFYDVVLMIDHFTQKLTVFSTGLPEKDERLKLKRARERLEKVVDQLSYLETTRSITRSQALDPSKVESNFTKEEYIKAVEKALDYIAQGDIYQVNLSQRFQFITNGSVDPIDLYQSLRSLSPSCCAAYMDGGDYKIISSSPERFLYLKDGYVQTRPMKGTRPRGESAELDTKFRNEILNSAKEKAELLMITDLERNDIGKVCEYGSVQVKDMRSIEEYKTVFQATSTVEGKLCDDKNSFDLLRACFPGGSITGCPKLRAMEIIDELEPTQRNIYTGSLGYIDFNGNMDFNILIRTLLAYPHKVYYQVGSGIVADSVPIEEYQETLIKAKAIEACLAHETTYHLSRR